MGLSKEAINVTAYEIQTAYSKGMNIDGMDK